MIDTLSICVATIFILVANFSTKRISMLSYALLCSFTYLIYWAFAGQMTALAMTVASVIGTLVQLAIPEKHLERTRPYRVAFAMTLGLIGFFISYKSPVDLIPLMGFLAGRVSETFTKPLTMRTGFMASALLWLTFAIVAQDVRAVLANVICLGGQIYSNCRDLNLLPKFEKKALQTA